MKKEIYFILPNIKTRRIFFGEISFVREENRFKVILSKLYKVYYSIYFINRKKYIVPFNGNTFNLKKINLNPIYNYFEFEVKENKLRLGPKGNVMLEPEIRGYGIGSLMMSILIEQTKKELPNVSVLPINLSFVDCRDKESWERRDTFYQNFGWEIFLFDEIGNGTTEAIPLNKLNPHFKKTTIFLDKPVEEVIKERKKISTLRYKLLKRKKEIIELQEMKQYLLNEKQKPILKIMKDRIQANSFIFNTKLLIEGIYHLFKR